MITKVIKLVLLFVFSTSIGSCDNITTKVEVVDEGGQPVQGAEVKFAYARPKGYESIKRSTDKEGKAQDKGETDFHLNLRVNKSGYYETYYDKSTGTSLDKNRNNELQVILREIKKPIPLSAKKTKIIAPVLAVDLGYDFSKGDWVAPHGEGKTTDVYFNVEYEKRARNDYDYQLTVSFPNELDGLLEFSDPRVSELKSPHQAPLKGYKPLWVQKTKQRPKEGRSGNRDRARNYWMRVRTQVDEEGEIVLANYVKVYGDFPEIQYYFNPTANDRNLEFDPKRNLLTGLGVDEQVREP